MDKNEMENQTFELEKKSKKDHRFLKGALLGALLMSLVAAGLIGTGVLKVNTLTKYAAVSGTEEAVDDETETKLELIRALADKYYLYDIDEDKLADGICKGYTEALDDEYTVYYDEEETKALLESTSGTYGGIGAVMTADEDTGYVKILSVYSDSPAEKAGLQAGDILTAVDGEDIGGQDLSDVVSKIKGEKGTEVKLTISRTGESQSQELTAQRDEIEAQTVEYEMKENQIGYLRITEFDSVTLDQFNNAMSDLRSQGMEKLVIDLRSNPGGNLDTVCDILRTMLPKGTIVYTEDKDNNRTDYTNDEDHTFDLPLVVLVDGSSASASEIFTGAVQDYGIGTIVGTKTYGKGVVQQLFDLQDGTYLKITVSQYFTPKGRTIQKKGIEPDVTVEYEKNEENPSADNQLDKALEILQQQ